MNRDAWKTMFERAACRYTDVPIAGRYMPIESPDDVVDAIVGVLDAIQTN